MRHSSHCRANPASDDQTLKKRRATALLDKKAI
jgi:hypothetical protein